MTLFAGKMPDGAFPAVVAAAVCPVRRDTVA